AWTEGQRQHAQDMREFDRIGRYASRDEMPDEDQKKWDQLGEYQNALGEDVQMYLGLDATKEKVEQFLDYLASFGWRQGSVDKAREFLGIHRELRPYVTALLRGGPTAAPLTPA